MNTNQTNPDTLTSHQYREAFLAVRDRLNDKQLAMLKTHYDAPDRKISARQMAAAVGYPNHATANLLYGKIGALLCELLGQEDDSDKLFVLSHLIAPDTEGNDEWLWEMRQPVAQALEDLGWV